MQKDKKLIGLTLITVLLLIIISFRIFFLISPEKSNEKEEDNENIEEIIIYEKNHSIFNVTESDIIVDRFAKAINDSPVKNKKLEFKYGFSRTYMYEFQNNSHLRIQYYQLKNNEIIINEIFLVPSALHKVNGSFDAEYAKKKMLNFVKDLLLEFDVNLGENYATSVEPWQQNQSWKVDIYQLYQGEILNGSGFSAIVGKENGEIRTMDVNDWFDPKSPIFENISIDEGRMIIFKELEEDDFNITDPSIVKNYSIKINITDIKFEGYNLLWGRLGYNYEISHQINETSDIFCRYIINIEDGKKLYWSYKSDGSGIGTEYYNNLL